jgi:hypothetical protein
VTNLAEPLLSVPSLLPPHRSATLFTLSALSPQPANALVNCPHCVVFGFDAAGETFAHS